MPRAVLLGIAMVAAGGSVVGQTVRVEWNASPSADVIAYRVDRDGTTQGETPGLAWDLSVTPGAEHTVAVRAVSPTGISVPASLTFTAPVQAPPPPPPEESCGPDGFGNGLDDDGDGQVDEGCAVPPPPPPEESCGADGYGNYLDDDGNGLIDETCAEPPTTVLTCDLDGTTYLVGQRANVVVKTSQIGAWMELHQDWRLIDRRPRNKVQTIITVECNP